jgi:hypothetical protein
MGEIHRFSKAAFEKNWQLFFTHSNSGLQFSQPDDVRGTWC